MCRGWWEELYEDRLIVMAGMEFMEWIQTFGFHMFDVVDSIPFFHSSNYNEHVLL
jgi:hypothetical protein